MRCLLVIVVGLFVARSLSGQVPQERDGFWWSIGLGYGTYSHACERCDRPSGSTGVTSGHATFGVALSRRITVGLELQAGSLRNDAGQTSISFVALYYPFASRGLFLRAGGGTSSYRQHAYEHDINYLGSGAGWLAAIGWDVRVDRKLSFTPMLTYRVGAPGTVVALAVDTAATNLRQRSVTFTLGLTFH